MAKSLVFIYCHRMFFFLKSKEKDRNLGKDPSYQDSSSFKSDSSFIKLSTSVVGLSSGKGSFR